MTTEQIPEHRTYDMSIMDLIKHIREMGRDLPKGEGTYLGHSLSADDVHELRSLWATEIKILRKRLRGPGLDLRGLLQVGDTPLKGSNRFNSQVRDEGRQNV